MHGDAKINVRRISISDLCVFTAFKHLCVHFGLIFLLHINNTYIQLIV